MKRKLSNIPEEKSKMNKLLFNNSKDFVEKFMSNEQNTDINLQPVWIDEDDNQFGEKITHKGVYTEKLKDKYQTLMGTPSWAQLNRNKKKVVNDNMLNTIGHLAPKQRFYLKKDVLNLKLLPLLNSETKNEGTIISTIEFHPKISAALVAGTSGNISLLSIGGDVNQKLHNFHLPHGKIISAQFTPDGSEAIIASEVSHNYCVYNLIKAEPKLVQLPEIIKTPKIFVLSPNGKYIATSDCLDEVYILCASSKELIRRLKHNNNVTALTFSPDCEKLYCYSIQGEVVIWDLLAFRITKKFYDQGCVQSSCITASSCGRLLATGSKEGILNVYETSQLSLAEPIPIKTISNLTTAITQLRFNPTSEILAASSSLLPNALKIIHIPSYHVFNNFPRHNEPMTIHRVNALNFSPASGYMAIGNNHGCALLYRLKHYKNY